MSDLFLCRDLSVSRDGFSSFMKWILEKIFCNFR